MEIIITAADANYFELVQGTILSIREKPQGRNAIIGFFDLGCTPEQIQWLQQRVNIIKQPDWEFNFPSIDEAPTHLKGLLARPFLRKYFPNFDIYLWIDADAWVQDWKAVDLFIEGAKIGRLAIVPEIDRGSEIQYGGLRKFWWQWVYNKYQQAFGEEIAENFYSYPVLNAGVFALHKDAPHWEVWAEFMHRGLQQSVSLMTDQFALNLAVYQGGLFDETEMLPAWCNWTYHHAFPSWDKDKSCFVEPYLPHTPIGILHLSGPDKEKQIQLKTTDRDVIELSLLYTAKLESSFVEQNGLLPVGDYVSPGFKIIQPDSCFPNMIVGDTSGCPWPYLRREIPHNWYADKRYPLIGFVSRDEAHILYNTALKFKGQKSLEIGCWMGWSACHLALGGVELDVIDPILEKPELYESVSNSLQAAGVLDAVKLIPGYSPEKVEEVAADGRKWSLIFIDGNHDAPGPLNDAIICETLAEADALILFHDLASPDVAQGLDYLKQRGWNTMIYQTMQIMGVAWRGNVEPVIHQPDPKIEWHLPEHLQSYLVSGKIAPDRVPERLTPQQKSAFLDPAQQPLVSVIIPCYNQAQFLPESVASVVAQTYENWEIIIVNDGSPDNTSTVARSLSAVYPERSIRLIEKANGGQGSARNAGIAAARGEYIMPLDADDKLNSNALEYLIKISLTSVVPCVAFGAYKMFGIEHHTVNSYDLYSPENLKNFNMLHPSSLYHKSVWHLVQGYKEDRAIQGYEDWEFWVNCHRQNIPFLGTREAIINYRRHPGSALTKVIERHKELLAQIVCYNWEIFDTETIKTAEEILDAAQISIFATQTAERLKKELNLREINLIVFPEWSQSEELLLEELEGIMRSLLTHPDRSKITLLVETSNISQESAELAISDVVMKILYEEDLDIESVGEISFISQLNQREWEALRPMICDRIIMKNENRSAIVESGCEHLPARDIESFSQG